MPAREIGARLLAVDPREEARKAALDWALYRIVRAVTRYLRRTKRAPRKTSEGTGETE